MTHDLFGKLRYKDRDQSWAGSATLPHFAAVGMLPDRAELTGEESSQALADVNAALDNMRELMRERFGEAGLAAFSEMERAAGAGADEVAAGQGEPDPAEEERERRRSDRRAKNAALLAKGKFPVRVAGPDGAGPTPSQEASFRFLLENEGAVFDAVAGQVWESFRNAYEQEDWRRIMSLRPAASVGNLQGRYAVTRVSVTREARGGFAHLVFLVDSDWQDEHGLAVVYSPDTREAAWTTWDGLYDLLESDEPEPPGEEYVPTPHDELLEAILTSNDEKARELVASGADINALGEDEYPPLWMAVDQIEPEEVRRLLAYGADPGLANPDERTTPLKHAKRMYRDMGFAPSKKRGAMEDGILSMMHAAVGKQMEEIRQRLEAIIRMLEEAEAK